MKARWAVFVSGRGSNLTTFLDSPDKVDLALVVGSNDKAYALKRAKRFGIPIYVTQKTVDWGKLQEVLEAYKVTSIFLAGFMKVLPESFIEKWKGKIFNVHPSLLPKYPGLKSIERAYKEEEDIGVTIHEVIPEVDQGKILLQKVAVSKENIKNFSLEQCEFYTHTVEQELIRQWVSGGAE